jgi:hypothetical protein
VVEDALSVRMVMTLRVGAGESGREKGKVVYPTDPLNPYLKPDMVESLQVL